MALDNGIHPELICKRRSIGIEDPSEDPLVPADRWVVVRVVLGVTCPGDDEVAVGVHGDVRLVLPVERCLIDADRVCVQGVADGVEPASVNAPATAVLEEAGPSDDEVAVAVHGDVRVHLIVEAVCVNAEFSAQKDARGVVPLADDSPFTAFARVTIGGPDDHEVAGGVHGHVGMVLTVEPRGIGHEFLSVLGLAERVVPAGEDAVQIAVTIAGPRDDVIAVLIRGDLGEFLRVLRELIHPNLHA